MRAVGDVGMMFGSEEELVNAYPNTGWHDDSQGYICQAVVVKKDGIEIDAVSCFFGQGRTVLISSDGEYLGDDNKLTNLVSARLGGAFLPMSLYRKAANL